VAGQDQVPQGLTLSPGSVQVSGSGPVNQPLTLSAQPTAPAGTYRLKVRATSGSLTREADLTVAVTAPPPSPGFTLALNPTSLTVQQGASGQTTLTVTPQNGFTGTVALSLVAGQDQVPQGLALSPGSLQVSGSGPVNQSLTLSAQPTTPTGTYRLKVRATSGSLTREADLTVAVTAPPPPPDFTLSLSPTSLTVQQGSSGQTTLTVTPQNGFTGTVSLSLVDGSGNSVPGITLDPPSVNVTGSGPVTQDLTVNVATSVAPNTYNLQLRATSGSLTKTAGLSLTVMATWTPRTSGTSNWLYGVAYGNGTFVAVGSGSGGTILTSPDGVNWTQRTSGTSDYLFLNDVTYGNGLFVAVGDYGVILTSSDGVTWTRRTLETSNWLYGVAYVNGLFVAVGYNVSGYRGIIFTSPDGVNWTPQTSGTANTLYNATYGNGLFVAVGDGGTILTSPDGVNWTQRTSGTSYSLRGVTYGNGLFVAVGDFSTILTSPDGVSWTPQRTSGTGDTFSLYDVTYGNGLFVAVGAVGIIFTSPDGVTWTGLQAPAGGNTLYDVTYGNGLFVAVGSYGTILTSP